MIQDRTKLYAGATLAVVLAAAGGFGAARLTAPKPAAEAPAEDHAEEPGVVTMAAPAIAASGILVQQVTAGGFAGEVQTQAVVVAAPDGQALLSARAPGAVTRIHKRLGDPVRAGEVVAVVESREAAQIAADRSAAAARSTLAQKTLAREQRLFEQRVSARQDFEQAQAEAGAASAEARRAQAAASAANLTGDGRGVAIVSPISGRITAASVSLGAFVQPETELFRVADPGRIQIHATVGGLDAARIAPGDRAILIAPDGREIVGVVAAITPALDSETRAATAVIEAPASGLAPGQSLRARLIPKAPAKSTAIAVPEEAVQALEGRDVVFVRTAQGFRAAPVTIGQRSGGRVEVIAGLTPGQGVAVRGAFLLKAELGKGEGEGH